MKKFQGTAQQTFGCILVPTDFSQQSIEALKQAKRLADGNPKAIQVIHVAEPLHVDWKADTTAFQKAAHQRARERLDELCQQVFGDNKPQTQFICGDPLTAIVKQASKVGADMIILGTHGRTGWKRALIGSVAERVVRYAKCPVMVVR